MVSCVFSDPFSQRASQLAEPNDFQSVCNQDRREDLFRAVLRLPFRKGYLVCHLGGESCCEFIACGLWVIRLIRCSASGMINTCTEF